MEDARFAAPAGPDTLRVLLATDNHLGFLEDDPVRGEDSFNTMEEILRIGREAHVDMVLLGGDLFHINKPSRNTMSKTVQLFRKYCLGSRDVELEVSGTFAHGERPNFEDENLAVDMPVFIIHGNHDDPTREGAQLEALSALDLLSDSGLVNYFGSVERLNNIEVKPLLIEKGLAKLKLYGLGWIRDERLHRLFAQDKVQFFTEPDGQPEQTAADLEAERTWFNMLVVHQNRDSKGRGAKNCFQESMIPEFMDFVMFGHEHECLVEPQAAIANDNILLCQPGSSVATSLIEGEAEDKHIGILEIALDRSELKPVCELTKIPLRSVRPFVMEELVLSTVDALEPDANEEDKLAVLEEVLEEKVGALVEEAKARYRERNPRARDKEVRKLLPLVRLRVEHTGFTPINLQRFAAKFVDKVANPNELISFFRKRRSDGAASRAAQGADQRAIEDRAAELAAEEDLSPQARINALVDEILATTANELRIIPEREFSSSIRDFVDKGGVRSIESYMDSLLQSQQELLLGQALETERDRVHNGEDVGELTEQIARGARKVAEQRNRAALQRERAEAAQGNVALDASDAGGQPARLARAASGASRGSRSNDSAADLGTRARSRAGAAPSAPSRARSGTGRNATNSRGRRAGAASVGSGGKGDNNGFDDEASEDEEAQPLRNTVSSRAAPARGKGQATRASGAAAPRAAARAAPARSGGESDGGDALAASPPRPARATAGRKAAPASPLPNPSPRKKPRTTRAAGALGRGRKPRFKKAASSEEEDGEDDSDGGGIGGRSTARGAAPTRTRPPRRQAAPFERLTEGDGGGDGGSQDSAIELESDNDDDYTPAPKRRRGRPGAIDLA